jgi:cell division septum initiation protein DivIVA
MDQPFTIRMRGYDRDEVDHYISQLFAEIDTASEQIEELKRVNPTEPEEVLGAEVERVLREARALATNVSGDAEQQASGLVEKARADAKHMLDDARAKSESRTTEARARAERMIANARSEAEHIIAEARNRLDALQKTEKELSVRLNEAVTATQAVVTDIDKKVTRSVDVSEAESQPSRPPARLSETGPIDLTRGQEDRATHQP